MLDLHLRARTPCHNFWKPLYLQGQNPEKDLGSGIWLKEGRILGSPKVSDRQPFWPVTFRC